MMKKLVVITGASSGFGMALAKLFNQDGYPLLLLARRVERLEALNLSNTICRKVDVTDREAFQKAIDDAEQQYGETDLLINSAGVMLLGDIETQNPDEWQKMLDVNVMGVLNGMRAVMPQMKKRQGGTIMNVDSLAGIEPFEHHAVYCASKYAVMGLSETARQQMAPYNVRVMRILPGAVNTELLSHTTSDQIKNDYVAGNKAAGMGTITADDIAKSIKFAYELPQGVNLREIQIADTKQVL
ncbi:SDR family oxidoreductase [Limosilactobacillus agrestis]|uniref:SDR family oxidoreductase n=2 Tax=Limosilactobacillus agrestis TaxID=2759748 RepID=A0ABS8R6J2_9LACO|nr:SDR family oxidoreductase [Limosilactobacillus agrestis]MCD7120052.1 SDR family oxidoreductase [Limosilactobacillus agrestis]MCD7125720.1 SDR family oxidoreductase [Limosilactobacillus agrestis]MCD7130245.1 SDR family oxidoreductase [Limosilactobacillus agrestis]